MQIRKYYTCCSFLIKINLISIFSLYSIYIFKNLPINIICLIFIISFQRQLIVMSQLKSRRTTQDSDNQNIGNYAPIADAQFKMYPARYFVTLIFSLALSMTSITLGTLNPIASSLTEIYDYSPFVINLGALLFTLMHPIFTFPAAYVIDTFGLRIGVCLGCILSLLGISARLFINHSFVFVIIGQIIAGIGRPFILNCQAKISANWFSAQTRGGITQILTLVLNVSLIIGLVIPSIFFADYSADSTNIQQGKDRAFNLMLFEAILGSVIFILNLLFIRDRPPTPPSQSAMMKREPFSLAIKKIVTNGNYMKLLLAFGCYFGIFNGVSIVLSFLIKPWFDGDGLATAAAAVGGSPIISGILGVMIIGPIQRKSGMFKKWILICMSGSTLAIILFYPFLQTQILFLVCFISAFNSFFLIPLVPIMLELACELAFPVGEGFAVGMLFACGNFFGFVMGAILSVIIRGQDKMETLGGLGFCLFIFLVGVTLIILLKQIKNREIAERQSQKRRSDRNSISSSNQSAAFTDSSEYVPPAVSFLLQEDSKL